MAMFSKKEPVLCSICGAVTGTPESKKHKAKDGIVCDDCFFSAGFNRHDACFAFPVEIIKEQIASTDGISIYDRFQKSAAVALGEMQAARKVESDGPVKCPKCGSDQISADKKGFGVGKAVVGAAVVGPLGLAAGNIGAKKVRVTCLKCGNSWMAGKG